MKTNLLIASALLAFACSTTLGAPEKLSPADQSAAFKAAGFKLKGKRWQACEDPTASYTPGAIKDVRDLNGDGLPEAIITEGGPGFCFPVEHWNGRQYAVQRHQYEGKDDVGNITRPFESYAYHIHHYDRCSDEYTFGSS